MGQCDYNIYDIMVKVFNMPKIRMNGQVAVSSKSLKDFEYLLKMNVKDIILFDNGTDELLEQGATILPRHYFIFVGTKDGELQFKPYEFNEFRIVVSTYKDIIMSIDSVG